MKFVTLLLYWLWGGHINMKKKFSMLTIALAASLGLVACGTGEGDKGTTTNGEAKIKVGMNDRFRNNWW